MFFKKKEKNVTWKKDGDYFTVYINGKETKGTIPNFWIGDDLLILLDKLNKYFLLKDHANLLDDVIKEAEYVAESHAILWSKSDDGYYLIENGEAVNDESEPFRIDEIMMVSYKNNGYLLMDYDDTEDNTLREADLISEPHQVHWLKIDEEFYMLSGGTLFDIDFSGNYCQDDIVVYLSQEEALFLLGDYKNVDNYVFFEAVRLAEKDELIFKKVGEGQFNLFSNEKTYHSESIATYHGDDAVVYVPELDSSFFLADLRNLDDSNYYQAQLLSTESNAFWSGENKSFSLIVNGDNIAGRTSDHNSWIGDDLLVYDPETSTTFLFRDFENNRDGQLREAIIVSRSAKAVWTSSQNNFKIWYEGKRTGKSEYQMMGPDLMVMPTDLKIMFQLKNFKNCQDSKLRPIE